MCSECEHRENEAVRRIAKSLGFQIEVLSHKDGTVTVRKLAKAGKGTIGKSYQKRLVALSGNGTPPGPLEYSGQELRTAVIDDPVIIDTGVKTTLHNGEVTEKRTMVFKRLAKKATARKDKDKPYGPWTVDETRTFIADVVGARHEDTVNERFELDTVAAELADKAFGADELWIELESNRLIKTDARSYRA